MNFNGSGDEKRMIDSGCFGGIIVTTDLYL